MSDKIVCPTCKKEFEEYRLYFGAERCPHCDRIFRQVLNPGCDPDEFARLNPHIDCPSTARLMQESHGKMANSMSKLCGAYDNFLSLNPFYCLAKWLDK